MATTSKVSGGRPDSADDIATNHSHLNVLEYWMRSYKPEELFDKEGRLIPEL
jgi:phosphoketolase